MLLLASQHVRYARTSLTHYTSRLRYLVAEAVVERQTSLVHLEANKRCAHAQELALREQKCKYCDGGGCGGAVRGAMEREVLWRMGERRRHLLLQHSSYYSTLNANTKALTPPITAPSTPPITRPCLTYCMTGGSLKCRVV